MMYLYFIIMLLQCLFAQGQEEVFLKANQHYVHEQYQEAALLYKTIENKGAAVWQNLGNCYWYMQQYKDAFVSYKRGLKNASFADKSLLEHQKSLAYERWIGAKEPVCTMGHKLGLMVEFFTVFQWQLICLMVLSAWSFGLRLWYNKRWFLAYNILSLVLLLIAFFGLYYAYLQDRPRGVIIVSTKLFVAPRKDVYCLKDIARGDDVVIVDSCNDWAKVNAQGIVGWIPNADYETL